MSNSDNFLHCLCCWNSELEIIKTAFLVFLFENWQLFPQRCLVHLGRKEIHRIFFSSRWGKQLFTTWIVSRYRGLLLYKYNIVYWNYYKIQRLTINTVSATQILHEISVYADELSGYITISVTGTVLIDIYAAQWPVNTVRRAAVPVRSVF